MPIVQNLEARGTYKAARAFVDRCLQTQDSLFTPGVSVWTSEALDDFHERFVVRADESSDTFRVKLVRQLDGARDETIQLVAELLYFHYLAPAQMSASTKEESIREVLNGMSQPVDIPEELLSPLETGVSSFGAAHAHRFAMVRFLLLFVRSWKELEDARREELLESPWAFKEWAFELERRGAYVQAEALLHLIFPRSFEAVVSREWKRLITDTWEDLVEAPEDDIDQRLLQVRSGLEEEYGEGFSFYEPRIRSRWEVEEGPWDEFIFWAQKIYEWEDFEEHERDYKLAIAEELKKVRETLETGEEWIEGLSRALNNNLVPWRSRDDFVKWCEANPGQSSNALRRLWNGEESLPDRIDAFTDVGDEPLYGARLRTTSVLLMALGARQHPPYAVTAFKAAFDLAGFPPPTDEATYGQKYRHAMAFLDRIQEESKKRGLDLRDRLDAQGIMWQLTKCTEDGAFVQQLDEEEWHRLQVFRGEEQEQTSTPEPDAKGDPLGDLAERLLLDRSFIARIRRLLRHKRQVIFYGPPGTGKTYVAQEFARTVTEAGGDYRLVQFHPSYAYEDFVEGYRPSEQAGSSGFALQEGPLKEIAEEALKDPANTYILIIDEINRGNVAKVLGELYFLLEYRDQEINLQYSGSGFRLPENLWLIGTMNTADRSIALMDTALRRRFYFVPFFPNQAPIEGLLGRWLDRHTQDLRWLADVVREANKRLDDEHFAIGPSYFMREGLSEEWVEIVWRHSILPYLEERFFGDSEALKRFDLEHLRGTVTGAIEEEAGGEKIRRTGRSVEDGEVGR